jgi:hypothetical protein
MLGRDAASLIASASARSFLARLTNGPLDEWFDVLRRNRAARRTDAATSGQRAQAHPVAELAEKPAPVVCPAAGLHHHLGGGLLGEERFELLALEVTPQDRAFPLIHAMECENVLGGIDGNALKFHGTVLGWWFDNPTLALDAGGPSTPTTAVTPDS